MKLTKKKAKELSIKKWEYIVGNDGEHEGLSDKYPELEDLMHWCGYCEKYYLQSCKNCPLNLMDKDCCCFNESHPYYKWMKKSIKSNAQKVLDLIRES